MTIHCQYCGQAAELTTGHEIYGGRADLSHLKFWKCDPCNAWVGCHKRDDWTHQDGRSVRSDGTLPMGVLANGELRAAKQRAHSAFDPLWREGAMTRANAYAWLKKETNFDDAHIGGCTVAQCRIVCEVSLRKRKSIEIENTNEQGSPVASLARLKQLTEQWRK